MTPVTKQLRQYKYMFVWQHGDTASTIVHMRVSTPRSDEFVSAVNGPGVIVFGMVSDEPFVRLSGFPLQHLDAIVAEIKRERARLLEDSNENR